MADITDGVDVVDGGSVVVGGEDFTVLGNFDSNVFEADLFGFGASSDGKEDGVVSVFDFVLSLLEGDYFSTFWVEFDAEGYGLLDKLDTSFFHVISDFIGELLVETSQENGSDHDGDITPKSMQESAAL